MKRRLTCCLAALVCLAFSCKEEPKAEELAAKAAENYYRLLMNGHYDRFVDGIADADSLPADYREQLLVNAKQMMAQQQKEHQGIHDIKTVKAQIDSTAQHQAQVFLLLCFNDSTEEEIVVPMVSHDKEWRMN